MVAYPGYTVRTIEEELSMREIRALLLCRKKQPTLAVLLNKVEQILEKHTGCRFQSMEPMPDDQLLNVLKGEGWI